MSLFPGRRKRAESEDLMGPKSWQMMKVYSHPSFINFLQMMWNSTFPVLETHLKKKSQSLRLTELI